MSSYAIIPASTAYCCRMCTLSGTFANPLLGHSSQKPSRVQLVYHPVHLQCLSQYWKNQSSSDKTCPVSACVAPIADNSVKKISKQVDELNKQSRWSVATVATATIFAVIVVRSLLPLEIPAVMEVGIEATGASLVLSIASVEGIRHDLLSQETVRSAALAGVTAIVGSVIGADKDVITGGYAGLIAGSVLALGSFGFHRNIKMFTGAILISMIASEIAAATTALKIATVGHGLLTMAIIEVGLLGGLIGKVFARPVIPVRS